MPDPYYEDDAVAIYHGDAREVVPSLEFDCIVTDPPYGVEYRQPRTQAAVVGDGGWTYARPEVPFVVWGANNSAWNVSDLGWLVWDKMRYGRDLFGDGELAATNCIRGVRVFPSKWGRQHGDGWTGLHPTEKPVVLIEWCIGFLPEDGVILDPFAGAGSTLRAAKNLRRKAIGVEVDEAYCEKAAGRMVQTVLRLEA